MGYRRNASRSGSYEKYTRAQIASVIRAIGISIVGETHSNFLAYCPFHGNRDTPSFTVSGDSGLFLCFNPGCDENGNLVHLVKRLTGRNDFEAMRFIKGKGEDTGIDIQDELKAASTPFEWVPWNPELLGKLRAGFAGSAGERYMTEERNFTLDTCNYFEVGYSEAQNMVTVPLHSPNDIPVGIIGRSIAEKEFKNSKDLPRSRTLFNLNRAKKQGDIVIVTESSFGTMRYHQAGFPNTVGTLGGNISPENLAHLDRYFSMIIIATDDDGKKVPPNCRKHAPGTCPGHNAGRELGMTIANALRNKNIMWAVNDYKEIYPRGEKDEGNLTDAEIHHVVNNAVSHFEYISWGLDFQ